GVPAEMPGAELAPVRRVAQNGVAVLTAEAPRALIDLAGVNETLRMGPTRTIECGGHRRASCPTERKEVTRRELRGGWNGRRGRRGYSALLVKGLKELVGPDWRNVHLAS